MISPFLVYYYCYYDEHFTEFVYEGKDNHVCCVMAENALDAIEQAKTMNGGMYLRIMGVATGTEDIVSDKPLDAMEMFEKSDRYKLRYNQHKKNN